jgi:hypothetical protein
MRKGLLTGASDSIATESRVAGAIKWSRSVGACGILIAIITSAFSGTLVIISASHSVPIEARLAGTCETSNCVAAGCISIAIIPAALSTTFITI